MTDPNWSGPGDEISGVVIAVDGNAITIRTDDGKEITLGGKMDPNQALIDARNAIGDFRNAISVPEMERAATKLADTFEALDKWLIKGGILPADWLPAKVRTTGLSRAAREEFGTLAKKITEKRDKE